MMKNSAQNTPRLMRIQNLPWLFIYLTAIILSACGTQPTTQPISPVATITASVAPAAPAPAVTEDAAGGTNDTSLSPTDESEDLGLDTIIDITTDVADRTPVPTSTPGRIEQRVSQFVQDTGLEGKTFLGLTVEDWINIGVSALILLVGYFIGIRLLAILLNAIVKRTPTKIDEEFLNTIGKELKWLVVTVLTRFSVLRLDFLSDRLRIGLDDLFFLTAIGILTIIALNFINFAVQRYREGLEASRDERTLDPIIVTVQRLAQFVVLVMSASIIMSQFGINMSALAILLLVGALIVSFGAKDIIADVFSGFIILIDQPFRVGDGIYIKDLETRGDVLAIGSRTTRIGTPDDREVIVPNTKIAQSEIVNYTYPDPGYRVQTDIGVAYGSDIKKMRQVIEAAVRSVKGVNPDKPVDVLFKSYGDSARNICVRWWIEDYRNDTRMLDKVNSTLEIALGEASIDLPFDTYNLNVSMQNEETGSDK